MYILESIRADTVRLRFVAFVESGPSIGEQMEHRPFFDMEVVL